MSGRALVRLFVALNLPDDVRDALNNVSGRLREMAAGARWVHMEGVHVTLKFIGEQPAEKESVIRAALSGVHATGPIELRFAGLGFFPTPKRPRVLWAGVLAGDMLRELAAAIEDALEPLGIPRETRAFNPHITLARFDSAMGLDALREAVASLGGAEFGSASAKEFGLYQSVLKRGGAEYTRLAGYPLAEVKPA